jgi:hypothetical protein
MGILKLLEILQITTNQPIADFAEIYTHCFKTFHFILKTRKPQLPEVVGNLKFPPKEKSSQTVQ